MARRRKIPVDYPPLCGECNVELKPLDWLVVTLTYQCPECRRGYQVPGRPKEIGWEKVEQYFDYTNARFPEPYELYDLPDHLTEQVQPFQASDEEEAG